mmetsp:Transcript_118815/g.236703  ORF Transcript_118815/g.236703 Transcript_118815/m.236703 type:complete len:200 (-) Transcript_118815:48-647(-)
MERDRERDLARTGRPGGGAFGFFCTGALDPPRALTSSPISFQSLSARSALDSKMPTSVPIPPSNTSCCSSRGKLHNAPIKVGENGRPTVRCNSPTRRSTWPCSHCLPSSSPASASAALFGGGLAALGTAFGGAFAGCAGGASGSASCSSSSSASSNTSSGIFLKLLKFLIGGATATGSSSLNASRIAAHAAASSSSIGG